MLISAGEGLSRPEPVLEVVDLTAGYGGVPVIKDVSATAGRGELVAVVGANGAGKSTLLKAIMGSISVLSGDIRVGGETVLETRTDRRTRLGLGLVPQVQAVFEPLTIRENLDVAAYLLHRAQVNSAIARVYELFPILRKLEKRRARTLSGGEKRILALGMALLYPRKVLLLDEPSAALAPNLASEFLSEHVKRVTASGTAVLMVEQRVEAALAVADWVYVFGMGRVEIAGTPDAVRSDESFSRLLVG